MEIKENMDWNKFEEGIKIIARQIKKSKTKIDGIYGVPRGGLIPAVRLSHLLKIPLTMFITPCTLIVDDVADSGNTIANWKYNKIATLYYKPHCSIEPDFYAFETKNWIVFPWEVSKRRK
jgi:hypothetical protein